MVTKVGAAGRRAVHPAGRPGGDEARLLLRRRHRGEGQPGAARSWWCGWSRSPPSRTTGSRATTSSPPTTSRRPSRSSASPSSTSTAVRKTVKKIQEKYTEKGFYLAEVTSRLEDRPDNQVVVVFVVNERAKVQVRRIHFVGNEHVSEGRDPPLHADAGGELPGLPLLGRAPTRRRRSSATSRPSRRSTSRRATSTSRSASPRSRSAPTATALFISIPIEEGEQYTVGKLDFSGELLGMRPFLPSLLQSTPGAALRPVQGGPRPLRGGRLLQGHGLRVRQREPAHEARPQGAARWGSPSTSSPGRRCSSSASRSGQRQDPRQGDPARAAHLRGRPLQRQRPSRSPSSASPPSATSRPSRSPPRRGAPTTASWRWWR